MASKEDKKILVLDFGNHLDYPIGGGLSFVKNLISGFGDQLKLVGITTEENEPVGKWFKKEFNGRLIDFFAIARYNKTKTKHLIPDRIVSFVLLKYYKRKILIEKISNVFIQRQEILISVRRFGLKNICYRFPGTENPLKISKYWFSKFLVGYFDKLFFKSLKEAKVILVAGDDKAIEEMILRSGNTFSKERFIKFPTRINTDIFKPMDKYDARQKLNLDPGKIIVTTSGRLTALKGWKFMVDSFAKFNLSHPGSTLIFIGEGEEEKSIREYVSANNLEQNVILAGRKPPGDLALFLNASDLYIMGSLIEGWSTSLSEVISCGIPACVTSFSSASEIIINGENGVVIPDRDTDLFAAGMIKCLQMQRPVYNQHVLLQSTKLLKSDLLKNWPLL